MLQTITTNLSKDIYEFLDNISKEKKITKRLVLEEALKLYKQKILEEEIKKGFENRLDEYKNNFSDFEALQSNSVKC